MPGAPFSMNQNSIGLRHLASARNANRFPGVAEQAESAAVRQPGKAGGKQPRGTRVDVQAFGSALFTEQTWEQIARSLGLSGREVQIVRGVFDDRVESTIAADLGISTHTVHTHFDRLHRKLGVGTRTGLMLRVTRQFLALTASSANDLPPPLAVSRPGRQRKPASEVVAPKRGVSAK